MPNNDKEFEAEDKEFEAEEEETPVTDTTEGITKEVYTDKNMYMTDEEQLIDNEFHADNPEEEKQ